MFERIENLIGQENLNSIKEKSVLVVGLGGVGGSCVESLIRSGISNIIIVDFDIIESSNINRQIIAFNDNIGTKKTEAMKKIIKKINPLCSVVIYDMFIDDSNLDMVFENKIDYVIDACDSVNTKKLLITKCIEKEINIISCMGTGNKLNPSMLSITELSKTENDPLAKVMRKWARDNKINKKIPVVSSVEVPMTKGKKIQSMCFVPNVAGILLANYVIGDIISPKIK